MKTNRKGSPRPAALILASALLGAAGCGGGESGKTSSAQAGGESSKREDGKPVTIEESQRLFQEQMRRDKGRSREEMVQLVTNIEDLQKKTIEVWGQHAALKGTPLARVAEIQYNGGTAAHVWGGLRIRLDGFHRRLKEFTDDQLPMLGPHIADEHRRIMRIYKRAIDQLAAAKKHQQ